MGPILILRSSTGHGSIHLRLEHTLLVGQSTLETNSVEGQRLSEDYGKDLTSVQNLQMKHVLLDADVGTHQDRIDRIRISSEQFVNAGHFDAGLIGCATTL